MISYQKKYYKYKKKYLELKKQLGGNMIDNFFEKYPYYKEKIDEEKIKIKFEDKDFNVVIIDKCVIIYNDIGDNLEYHYLENCTTSISIEKINNTEKLLNLILEIFNIPYSYSNIKINDDFEPFFDIYIYLNKSHELYYTINNVLSSKFNIILGISNDLLTDKLYSINFIWLRIKSFTEICFSINGTEDINVDLTSIDNILKLQENSFFIKLINWSRNNPEALINFWIDNTQVNLITLINLRLVFDVLNRNLGLNLCIRNIWSLNITRVMDEKYPEVLPKGTGHSLIMRVDLYKCIIGIEELERHMYSVFADLDMKPVGPDIILSSSNINILNRIGIVLTKLNFNDLFENGFQILGSSIPKNKLAIIETFKIMLIERTMFICKNIKKIEQFNIQQLVYHLYQQMYNYLYFKCGYGLLYYIFDIKPIKIKNNEDMENYIKKNIFENSYEYLNLTDIYYISFDLFDNPRIYDLFSDNYENIEELIQFIKENVKKDKLCDYVKKLRFIVKKTLGDTSKSPLVKKCLSDDFDYYELLCNCQVKEDDLIIFDDLTTLPPSKHDWPFRMNKKYNIK